MLFIRQKRYLMPQTADTAALSRFFWRRMKGGRLKPWKSVFRRPPRPIHRHSDAWIDGRLFEIGDFCTINAQDFKVLQMLQHFFGFLFAAFNMAFDCIAQCFGFIGAVLYR